MSEEVRARACASPNGDPGGDGRSTTVIREPATALSYAHDSGEDAREDAEPELRVSDDMETGVGGASGAKTGDVLTCVICTAAGVVPLVE